MRGLKKRINKTMSSDELCKICNKVQFKYSCPKCNIPYCSLTCYKSADHQKCSEEFYKECVEEELAATAANSLPTEDVRKMYEILSRMNQLQDDQYDADEAQQQLDSDDDGLEDDSIELANRLEGIDINDSDSVWNQLTDDEKKEFQDMIDNGEIMKLLPKYQPWWSSQGSKLITVVTDDKIPAIYDKIPPFSSIFSKEPPPCIHNNLWNVVASYACTVRYFDGDHQCNLWAACTYLYDLSANLKRNTNFDDAEEALASIKEEAIKKNGSLPCEQFTEIIKDSQQIMSTVDLKLAALSDTLRMFRDGKKQQYGKEAKEVSQRFDLSRPKIRLAIKKIEFLLSFVSRDKLK